MLDKIRKYLRGLLEILGQELIVTSLVVLVIIVLTLLIWEVLTQWLEWHR